MRVAVLIIGLLLGLLMFLQSVLVYGLSDATNADDTDAMAVGVMVALLWLIACAFVLPFPMVSTVVFVVAGLLAFAISGEFPDMGVWGVVSLVLAVLSFFGWRGMRKARREQKAERQCQLDRDARLEALLHQQGGQDQA